MSGQLLQNIEENKQKDFIKIIKELKLSAKRLGTVEINFDFSSNDLKNFRAHAWTFFQTINNTSDVPNKYILKKMDKKILYQYFLMSVCQIFSEKKIDIKTFGFGSGNENIKLKSRKYRINCHTNNRRIFEKLLNDIRIMALSNEVKLKDNYNLFNLS